MLRKLTVFAKKKIEKHYDWVFRYSLMFLVEERIPHIASLSMHQFFFILYVDLSFHVVLS